MLGRHKKKESRINNLRIRYNKLYGKWRVISPSGVVLEEFSTKRKAIKSAKETEDFISG